MRSPAGSNIYENSFALKSRFSCQTNFSEAQGGEMWLVEETTEELLIEKEMKLTLRFHR